MNRINQMSDALIRPFSLEVGFGEEVEKLRKDARRVMIAAPYLDSAKAPQAARILATIGTQRADKGNKQFSENILSILISTPQWLISLDDKEPTPVRNAALEIHSTLQRRGELVRHQLAAV